MNQSKKCLWLLAALISFSLLAASNPAFAESLNDSVEDNIQKKTNQEDEQKTKQETPPVDKGETADIGISGWEMIKMVGALAFVIFLLYSLLKFINKRSQTYQQNRLVQHYGGTPLGGNRSIQIVKAGKRVLVIGVGENIQLLKEITDEDELRAFKEQYENQVNDSLKPSDLISKLFRLWRHDPDERNRKNGGHHFSDILQAQMDEVKNSRKKVMADLAKKEQNQDE